jgi:hypothetical protein
MARTKRRNVDVVSPVISLNEDDKGPIPSFEDVLNYLNGKKQNLRGKAFEFSLLDTELENCTAGMVVTNQVRDIPPKKNKFTGLYQPVQIDLAKEGLAFANVFIYDAKRNVLIYEVNKNGCYLDQLRTFILSKWNRDENNVKLHKFHFRAVVRHHEYDRMLRMSYYKRFKLEMLNPSSMVECFKEDNDSMFRNFLRNNANAGKSGNADVFVLEQIATSKQVNPMGLASTMVKGLVDTLRLTLPGGMLRQNIKTLIVEGYTTDTDSPRKLVPIDLLADSFKESFKLTDVQVHIDVQQQERTKGIQEVYQKILPELKRILE